MTRLPENLTPCETHLWAQVDVWELGAVVPAEQGRTNGGCLFHDVTAYIPTMFSMSGTLVLLFAAEGQVGGMVVL